MKRRTKPESLELDHEACYRAMRQRDARFDGRLFIGVKTTGIYCRPVCPARTPFSKNVIFFPTAAAAQALVPPASRRLAGRGRADAACAARQTAHS
jgi:methylphosphotriester-DNA--protein-cysteine methyltransferase